MHLPRTPEWQPQLTDPLPRADVGTPQLPLHQRPWAALGCVRSRQAPQPRAATLLAPEDLQMCVRGQSARLLLASYGQQAAQSPQTLSLVPSHMDGATNSRGRGKRAGGWSVFPALGRHRERLLFNDETEWERGRREGSDIPVHLHPPGPRNNGSGRKSSGQTDGRGQCLFWSWAGVGGWGGKQDTAAQTGTEAGGRRKRYVRLTARTQTHPWSQCYTHTHSWCGARTHRHMQS